MKPSRLFSIHTVFEGKQNPKIKYLTINTGPKAENKNRPHLASNWVAQTPEEARTLAYTYHNTH